MAVQATALSPPKDNAVGVMTIPLRIAPCVDPAVPDYYKNPLLLAFWREAPGFAYDIRRSGASIGAYKARLSLSRY